MDLQKFKEWVNMYSLVDGFIHSFLIRESFGDFPLYVIADDNTYNVYRPYVVEENEMESVEYRLWTPYAGWMIPIGNGNEMDAIRNRLENPIPTFEAMVKRRRLEFIQELVDSGNAHIKVGDWVIRTLDDLYIGTYEDSPFVSSKKEGIKILARDNSVTDKEYKVNRIHAGLYVFVSKNKDMDFQKEYYVEKITSENFDDFLSEYRALILSENYCPNSIDGEADCE